MSKQQLESGVCIVVPKLVYIVWSLQPVLWTPVQQNMLCILPITKISTNYVLWGLEDPTKHIKVKGKRLRSLFYNIE